MAYLLDTNIISELVRPQPNSGVRACVNDLPRIAISVISLDEIYFGLAWRPNPRIHAWMDAFFQAQDVLPVTPSIARQSGELRGQFARRGIVRSQADLLIAATAQAYQLTLVTRNTRDFEDCGIGLLSPFSP